MISSRVMGSGENFQRLLIFNFKGHRAAQSPFAHCLDQVVDFLSQRIQGRQFNLTAFCFSLILTEQSLNGVQGLPVGHLRMVVVH